MLEVYHWQAENRWWKQAFSDVKGTTTEEDIMPTHLFSEQWVQSREMLFLGQSGTHNTLKGSLYFCLNYDDKYQQENGIAMKAATWRQQTGKRGQLWRPSSDSNHRGQIVFPGHLEFISSFCQGLETYHCNTHLGNFYWYQEVIPSQRILGNCLCYNYLMELQVSLCKEHLNNNLENTTV